MYRDGTTGLGLKGVVRVAIEERGGQFVRLAHDIYSHPEKAFAETMASSWIAALLSAEGFEVEAGVCGLATAFIASAGSGPLHVALCAEYDACGDGPSHECGHHLVAGAAVAAAVGLTGALGSLPVRVSVVGTSREHPFQVGRPWATCVCAGKITLLEGNAFDGIHAVLSVHPGRGSSTRFLPSFAGQRLRAHFIAQPTASGAAPQTQHPASPESLASIRRALREPPFGVVCASTISTLQTETLLAARSVAELADLRASTRAWLEAAASSAGVTVKVTESEPVAELRQDPELTRLYRANSTALRDPSDELHTSSSSWAPLLRSVLWTDLGNVSRVIPTICATFGIDREAGRTEVPVALRTDSDEAYRAMLDSAVALAWTVIDLATRSPSLDYLLRARARLEAVSADGSAAPTRPGGRHSRGGPAY